MSARNLNLLFDLDRTLVNPGEGILALLRKAFSSLGLEAPPLSPLEDAIGPPLHIVLGTLPATDDQQLIWRGVTEGNRRGQSQVPDCFAPTPVLAR